MAPMAAWVAMATMGAMACTATWVVTVAMVSTEPMDRMALEDRETPSARPRQQEEMASMATCVAIGGGQLLRWRWHPHHVCDRWWRWGHRYQLSDRWRRWRWRRWRSSLRTRTPGRQRHRHHLCSFQYFFIRRHRGLRGRGGAVFMGGRGLRLRSPMKALRPRRRGWRGRDPPTSDAWPTGSGIWSGGGSSDAVCNANTDAMKLNSRILKPFDSVNSITLHWF